VDGKQLIAYLQLINTTGVGPIHFHRLVERFGSVEEALKELSLKRKIFPKEKAEEEILLAESKNIHILTETDELYPYNLKQIDDFPPVLYALGNIDLLANDNMLAVVGSRNASLSAQKFAKQLSEATAQKGITIVSGLARGIDAAAHSGALAAEGRTIAVLGTGVDVCYPKENEKLYKEIAQKGLILSEYPLGTTPVAQNFPRRNRIVSGLSKGVLVAEAGIQSGSLITARQALEQGREVYAIPGAPYDGRSSGCNKLLKEGAVFVDSVEDIVANFNFSPQKFIKKEVEKSVTADLFEYSLDNPKNNSDSSGQTDAQSAFLSLISANGEDIDDLIRASGLPTATVMTMIVELELEDKVIRIPGNKIAKV
jgi:DNA processing protein